MHRAKQASKQTNKQSTGLPSAAAAQHSISSRNARALQRSQQGIWLRQSLFCLAGGACHRSAAHFLRRSASGRAPEAVAALHCARPIEVAARRILLNVHNSEFGSLR
jgi:hypothetical protein